TILAAVDVAICWWALGRLAIRTSIRVAGTLFLAFGTVFWYTAQVTTTWYQAHIVAVGLTLLAVGIAIGRHRTSADDSGFDDRPGWLPRSLPELRRIVVPDGHQFAAGFLFGLACTARLTVLLAAPFFSFVCGGGGWRRRASS